MTAPARDGVSVVVTARTPVSPVVLGAWEEHLRTAGRPWEVLSVADARGCGAAVRSALPLVKHPLVLLTDDSYPYTPSDLTKLIERIETPGEMPDPKTGEWGMRTPDLVAGARTGVPEPGLLKVGGAIFRGFCKIVLDLVLEPRPGWYGWAEHRKVTRAWLTYGVPLHDPHCGFKLVRRALLERFPIQCDGELFHVELVAKATFLTCMMDEVPLMPKPDRVRPAIWSKADKKVLWGKPRFAHKQEEPPPREPNVFAASVSEPGKS